MALVNFDFYEDEDKYGGITIKDEDEFNRILRRATVVLNRLTFNRIVLNDDGQYGQMVHGKFLAFSSSELESLKYGLCSLVDAMNKLQTAEAQALAGNGDSGNVKSRSSGGESVSYESKKTAYDESLTDETKRNALYRSALREYIQPDAFRYNPFYAGSW